MAESQDTAVADFQPWLRPGARRQHAGGTATTHLRYRGSLRHPLSRLQHQPGM